MERIEKTLFFADEVFLCIILSHGQTIQFGAVVSRPDVLDQDKSGSRTAYHRFKDQV